MLNSGPEMEQECLLEIVQIGRQPILDRNQQTFGYELLYRYNNKGAGEDAIDGDLITARTLLFTFLEFGVKHLVGDHRAFVNLTKQFFTDMHIPMLDKERFVLEVLENIQIDSELVNGVRKLHKNGFCIALDDYRFESHWEPLLPCCSIIKVDIQGLNLASFAEEISGLKAKGLVLLAEKVETHAEYEMAFEPGFDLFQGYFFAKPQILSTRLLQTNQTLLLKVISRINDPTVDLDELAKLISLDPKLSFKVLRFINSASLGFTKRISSIQQAVMYIGLKKLRAWASLFIMSEMQSKNSELLKTGLIRAEMCYFISRELAIDDPESAYTVGLLSILDALLNRPLDELVKDMPLPVEMTQALIERTGKYSIGLNCVLALEQGRPPEACEEWVTPDKVITNYVKAIANTENILNELGGLH